jgi:hypothetical protein
MGLTGAIIVRPSGFNANAPTAYGHPDTAYNYEQLFFLTEMDPNIHQAVEFYGPEHPSIQPMLDNYFSNYWFINGRTAPDNLAASNVFWLPSQPYNSVPRMHPGDSIIMAIMPRSSRGMEECLKVHQAQGRTLVPRVLQLPQHREKPWMPSSPGLVKG